MAAQNSFCLLLVIGFLSLSFIEASTIGFSLDLIHRDSAQSPLYNSSHSQYDRINNAVVRSFLRHKSSSKISTKRGSSGGIQSQIASNNGEYLMKLSIGTPAVEILAIADTGSDLTWTQCKPCVACYKQNAPLFDPLTTSSYKNLSCQSQLCEAVGTSTCGAKNNCQYEVSYGDSSYSYGQLAFETLTFKSISGRSIKIPKVVFGCGHENDGTFNESGSGIIGLGGGSISIIKQLESYIGGLFSYCLVPIDSSPNVTSKINFGTAAKVSGPGLVTTPLIKKTPDTFYYLTLEGVSVGKKRIPFQGFAKDDLGDGEEGNIIIDSGTTLTFLPEDMYTSLESSLIDSIQGKRTNDSQGLFHLCYESSENLNVPKITFHFTGADVVLNPLIIFVEVEEGVACLTVVPNEQLAIFGNLGQMNYHIGYDLVGNKLSFQPTDCTKH